jgi:hypothetical protein
MIQEIFDAVKELNALYRRVESAVDGDDSYHGFVLRTDGIDHVVLFMGVRIWSSHESYIRESYEDYDIDGFPVDTELVGTYEPYTRCFAREALHVLNQLKAARKPLLEYAKAEGPVPLGRYRE